MGVLHTLHLENFKSFRGKQVIGPFKRFTAIIGPNGCGKSNLMDAISFVLGEKATSLRIRSLRDLIHGASIGKPVSSRCSVTLNYKGDDGRLISFTRSVISTGSEFRINGKVVSVQQYNQEMESIHIFIKAKNFLVYQGQIESIVMMNPRERTALFEEISRSCELRREYDRLKAELQEAEDDARQNLIKRRAIAHEKREAKLERDQAEKYQRMKDDLAAKQHLLFLFELFYCERDGKQAQDRLVREKDLVAELKTRKNEADKLVNEKQRILKKAQRDNLKLEMEITDKDREVSHHGLLYVQLKQEALHLQKKLETSCKTLKAAQKLAKRNEEQVEMLEKSAKELERKKTECEAELESQSQELELHLNEQQINEYISLKRLAGKKSGIVDMQLNSLKGEHETDRSSKVNEERRMKAWQEKIKNKKQEIERVKKQIEHLAENAEQQTVILYGEKVNLITMENQVKESKELLEKVSIELSEVDRQLLDASSESMESERVRRRKEAIENLKRVFPEKVYGRLVDLCQPCHKRFHLAVAKVLQKHMMSIVCDSEDTARVAITYLKEQRYPPETFLPYHGLDVHPINEKLRELRNPEGVKLVYDVMQCNHPAARKALQFACDNAVICETPEDARTLAYGIAGGYRYKAVSLDGTMFQPNGLISGGSQEMKIHAKKWDENALRQLRERRAQLLEESNSLHRIRRKELDVEMQRNRLTFVENRLRNVQLEKSKCETDTLNKLTLELQLLESELNLVLPKIEVIEERMVKREREIKKLEERSNAVADEVFADFCRKVGLKNIREYEEREMRFYRGRIGQMREFDNELDLIRNEIEYLRSEDRNKKVEEEIDKVKNLEEKLDLLEKKRAKEGNVLNRLENEMEELKAGAMVKETEQKQYEAELAVVKKEAEVAQRDVTTAEKAVLVLESVVSRKRAYRHELLHSAKINQIQLPLVSGSLADVSGEEEEESQPFPTHSTNLSQKQIERESRIKVNYIQLPEDLKELEDEDEVKGYVERMKKELDDAKAKLSRLNAPNFRAVQKTEELNEQEAKTAEECENARRKARHIRVQFEKVKNERYRKFQEFFEPVSQKIDSIYKSLTRDASAQALLCAGNMEEPYLEGIQYNCVAPGKRFLPIDNLSGGEQGVAALALLFAMRARKPSPFFVVDEIDASLDSTNIEKVSSFICESARNDVQMIVISLKEEFYNKADALIGVFPGAAHCSSGVLAFDLTPYKQTDISGSNSTLTGSSHISP